MLPAGALASLFKLAHYRYDKHIRWVVAATSSIVIGNAAFDVAVSVHPRERVLLRQGIRVIREHVPRNEV
jgi:hypothetical protein